MRKPPDVTIITSSLNPNLSVFRTVLESIKSQVYPSTIQHIVLDGGSDNGSVQLAQQYGCRVLNFSDTPDEGGTRLYTGLKYVHGEVVLLLETDNILPEKNWVKRLIAPFEDKRIFSTFPAYNSYTSDMNILTRYSALMGSPDPTLYYLGKSDKIPVYQKTYDKGTIIDEKPDYWTVRFVQQDLPTVGDNGYIVKRSALKKIVKKGKPYIHVDAFAQLLKQGYDTYGVVKNSIIHVSPPGLLRQVSRRVAVKQHFTDQRRNERVYFVFNRNSRRDRVNLLLYIVKSVTLVEPLLLSIRGYMYRPDIAWFIHPVFCILMVLGYSISELKRILGGSRVRMYCL